MPAVPHVDSIRVERSYPKPKLVLVEVKDPKQIEKIAAFINARLHGWSTPWSGAPIGKVYLDFYADEKFVGNFYVGPGFFGRDLGTRFFSKRAEEKDVAELGRLLGLPLVEMARAQ